MVATALLSLCLGTAADCLDTANVECNANCDIEVECEFRTLDQCQAASCNPLTGAITAPGIDSCLAACARDAGEPTGGDGGVGLPRDRVHDGVRCALVEAHGPAINSESYLPPRHKALMSHDLFTSEVITRIIELARPIGLSGLMVFRENRIDPRYRRPVVDALIVVRYDPTEPADPYHVPWTKDPYMKTEWRRRWALENDRGSEALNILAAKAEHYKQVNTLEWRTINDSFPVPLLVTTSQRRMERIFDLWRGIWPAGAWLMTTDAGLQADTWQLYNQGQVRERGLFRGTVAEAEVADGRLFSQEEPTP